ncbi:hypothetical protein EPN81_04255 [Patescibacteria group bacterium]|nr:MAG: hypothetical protein EPN81_04255 [Patescibacteria group bacterium]
MSGTELPYCGSPLSDPRAEKIAEFTGLLPQQADSFKAWIASLRAGHRSCDVGYVQTPMNVDLLMSDGTRIQGRTLIEGIVVLLSGDIRFLLSQWDHNRFIRCVIVIRGHDIDVDVYLNPPDQQANWRPASPTIIPPLASGVTITSPTTSTPTT